MPNPLIQSAFTAGEISPALWGQVDLRKYQTGTKVSRNMLVDFRGGQISRPGTAFVDAGLPNYAEFPPVLLPFVFNQDQAYVLEFSQSLVHDKQMRVIYRGSPVLEAALPVTAATASDPSTVTIAGSAPAVGDRWYFEGVGGLLRANGTSAINGRTLQVVGFTGSDVQLKDPTTGLAFNAAALTAYTSGGTAAREVSVASPWGGADLFDLKYAQSADVMTICHPNYPIYEVRRQAHNVWSIAVATIGSSLGQPGITSIVAINNLGTDPQFFYAYTITAFNTRTGQESSIDSTGAASVFNRALNQNTGVVNQFRWTAQDGANLYRLYKAQPIPAGYQGPPPYFWGLVGETAALQFTDANFEPNFAITPPTGDNPFEVGVVAGLTLVQPGYGYINPIIQIQDSQGIGAQATATIDAAGAIQSPITLVDAGAGYRAPTAVIIEDRNSFVAGSGLSLAFSDTWVAVNPGVSYAPAPGSITISTPGSGFHVPQIRYNYSGGGITSFSEGLLVGTTTGAAVTGLLNGGGGVAQSAAPPSGGTMTFSIVDYAADSFDYSLATASVQIAGVNTDNPSCVSYFQQRRVYAASLANPATFWMSRPGDYDNFDTSYPVQSGDAITATLANGEVNAINSLTPMTTGLVALTSGGAALISGDSNGAPVTPSTINARAQTFAGAAPIQPLRINEQLIYVQAQGTSVRDLTYDFFVNAYKGADLSVLSDHLFRGRTIKQWAYAAEPHKIVWAVRDDGVLLAMTYLKEQEVTGWTHCDTSGQFVSVCSIPEPGVSAVYVVVRRWLGGDAAGYQYFTERLTEREFGANTAMNVPSNPELAWCVDCGARYPLTTPDATLYQSGSLLGMLGTPTLVAGGSGYTGTPFVQVLDPTGSGGEVSVTITAGVVTAVSLVTGGTGYTNPQVLVGTDEGGFGCVISVPVTNIVEFFASSAIFSGADIGKVLRVGGGKGVVTAVPSAAFIDVDMSVLVAGRVPNTEDAIIPPTVAGLWSLTAPVTAVAGLDYFNGATVQVVADGSVVGPQVVVDGCITLDVAASAITVGQGFTCQFQSLRPDTGLPTTQARRKSISTVTIRVQDTRGAQIGGDFKDMYEIKERDDENFGQPISFQIGGGVLDPLYEGAPIGMNPVGYLDFLTNIDGGWTVDGTFALMQSWPMPLQVLAFITEITIGDTP